LSHEPLEEEPEDWEGDFDEEDSEMEITDVSSDSGEEGDDSTDVDCDPSQEERCSFWYSCHWNHPFKFKIIFFMGATYSLISTQAA